MRLAAFPAVFVLCGALSADVLLLKDGSRVSGRVSEKPTHFEVNTDAGLRTYLKEEVDRVLAGPGEILGDADQILAESKADYDRIAGLPAAEQSGPAKAAVEKLNRARTAISAAREAFPEERYADLDQKLLDCMRLLRLLRDRVGSSYARASGPRMVNGAPPMTPGEALAAAADPAKRADPAARASALESFRRLRADAPASSEVAAAVAAFLSRPDAEWRLDPAALKALQDYFAKPWVRELATLAPAGHLEAATWIAAQSASPGKSGAEPLLLLGLGHLAHALPGAEAEKLARGWGLAPVQGVWGSAEGHAVRDMDAWIASGDFDLAVLSFVKEHRGADTASVRYVWAYALLRVVQAKKRGWDRPVSALTAIRAPSKPIEEHVAALVKSIKAAASCNLCEGQGRLRCTNCFGRKEIRNVCEKCMGSGKMLPPGANDPTGFRFRAAAPVQCYPCRGRGFSLLIKCTKCTDGSVDCKQCAAPKPPPELEEIMAAAPCATCEGRGSVFRGLAWPCAPCLGLGQRLAPKADPAKLLP
jgi:hypothetical protein